MLLPGENTKCESVRKAAQCVTKYSHVYSPEERPLSGGDTEASLLFCSNIARRFFMLDMLTSFIEPMALELVLES